MRTRSFRFALAVLSAGMASVFACRAAADPVMPPALASLHAFRGRIDYVVRMDGAPSSQTVSGTLVVGTSWSLQERAASYVLDAAPSAASIKSGDDAAQIDDVLSCDPLENAWAAALGRAATGVLSPSASSPSVWSGADGIRFYVDPTGWRLIGIGDDAGRGATDFVFDDWTHAAGIDLPRHILRLRSGSPDAAFTVLRYAVIAAPPGMAVSGPAMAAAAPAVRSDLDRLLLGQSTPPGLPIALELCALVCVLLVGGFLMLWARRDALILNVCRRMAADPRGWRRAGTSIFVGPDGALLMDGLKYRVGPHFYNRAALVQTSILFVRVSAPGVPCCVILPRKFRPVDLGIAQRKQRRAAAGFTLIETIVATTLFAAVLLLGIYPALAALSRADALAQRRAMAVVIASNALADEQAANDYDAGAPQGQSVSQVDDLTLTISVTPTAVRGTSDLTISVTDAGGDELAAVATLLGPPVKAPPDSGGGPPSR
jgi:type II secretory pathway pseudopilin PulG